MKSHLLIIDPQFDFLDIDGAALPVRGAEADMQRLAAFMERQGVDLGGITVTLDTHELHDIGHPTFWRDARGEIPGAFTQVTLDDVVKGRMAPADPADDRWVRTYLMGLEAQGRYTHMIWPTHCQVGTRGHNIAAPVLEQLTAWETKTNRRALRVLKGMNRLVEHYSAVRAEVVYPGDEHTNVNSTLLRALRDCDRLYIAGEASSHCVKATVEHLVQYLPGRGLAAKKMVLLTDAMSPVPGFEAQASDFLTTMAARGALLAKTTD